MENILATITMRHGNRSTLSLSPVGRPAAILHFLCPTSFCSEVSTEGLKGAVELLNPRTPSKLPAGVLGPDLQVAAEDLDSAQVSQQRRHFEQGTHLRQSPHSSCSSFSPHRQSLHLMRRAPYGQYHQGSRLHRQKSPSFPTIH